MDSPSRQIARFIRRHGTAYLPGHEIRLIAREDRFGRGGDHTAFNRRGFPGVRFSESRENYSRQHEPEDTLGGVDFEYLAKNARVNAASVATMALAPQAPTSWVPRGPRLGRGGPGYDADEAVEISRKIIDNRKASVTFMKSGFLKAQAAFGRGGSPGKASFRKSAGSASLATVQNPIAVFTAVWTAKDQRDKLGKNVLADVAVRICGP